MIPQPIVLTLGLRLVSNKVLRGDPTRTTMLRKAYMKGAVDRFKKVRHDIKVSVLDNDVFGIAEPTPFKTLTPLPRKAFEFSTDAQKIDQFMAWLQGQVDKDILEVVSRDGLKIIDRKEWQNAYIDSSYKKGMQRAHDELIKTGVIPEDQFPPPQYFNVDAAFNRPIHIGRVQALYTRNFNELRGITQAMDQQISRTLAQGLADGRGPASLARDLVDRVDKIGITRARMLARTEVIRAHHVGLINSYREARIEGVIVKAEWSVAGFDVCPICEGFEGQVFKLDVIEGMIPAHPNCRCTAIPWIKGVTDKEEREEEKEVRERRVVRRKKPVGFKELSAEQIKSLQKESGTFLRKQFPRSRLDPGVMGYTHTGAKLNAKLRMGGVKAKKALNTTSAKVLDEAIAKAVPLTRNVVVRRFTADASFVGKVGSKFSDKGFVSTCLSGKRFNRVKKGLEGQYDVFKEGLKGVEFRIRIPKGTKGLTVPNFLSGPYPESEYILPRGSSFKVIKKAADVIDLELV